MLFLLLNIAVPVILGGAYYVFFSPKVHFVDWIKKATGLSPGSGRLPEGFPFRDFIMKHGADALWAYALVFALFLALGREKKYLPAALCLALMLSALTEGAQCLPGISGTFDVRDLITEAFAAAAAATVIKLFYAEGAITEKP